MFENKLIIIVWYLSFRLKKNLEWLCNFAEVVTKFLQVNRVKSDHGDLDHVKAVGRLAFFRD